MEMDFSQSTQKGTQLSNVHFNLERTSGEDSTMPDPGFEPTEAKNNKQLDLKP